MSIAPVSAILSADAPTKALIGNPARVYSAGNIPQDSGTPVNQNLPCVTWQTVAGLPENAMDDRPVLDGTRVQVDCWSAVNLAAAYALAAVVHAALELKGYCVSGNMDSYESDTKRYCVSFDYSFLVPH